MDDTLAGGGGGHSRHPGCHRPQAAEPALTSAKIQINIETTCIGLGVEVEWRWCGLTDFFFTIGGVGWSWLLWLFNFIYEWSALIEQKTGTYVLT